MTDEYTGEETTTCYSCGHAWPHDTAYWFFEGQSPVQPCKECTRVAIEKQKQTAMISAGQNARELIRKIAGGDLQLLETSEVEHMFDDIVAGLRESGTSMAELIVCDLLNTDKAAVRVQLYNTVIGLAKEASRLRSESKQAMADVDPEDLERIIATILSKSGGSNDEPAPE